MRPCDLEFPGRPVRELISWRRRLRSELGGPMYIGVGTLILIIILVLLLT
jgi:hypothetical protein